MNEQTITEIADYVEDAVWKYKDEEADSIMKQYYDGKKDAALDLIDEMGIQTEVFQEISRRGNVDIKKDAI